jgi:hypothetical protein
VILRIFLWNLADSKTTIEELREQLPPLASGDAWVTNEASERFGLVTFEEEPPVGLAHIRDLIGRDPEVAEEFDVESQD